MTAQPNPYEAHSITTVYALYITMSTRHSNTCLYPIYPDEVEGWSLWIDMDGSLHWRGNISVDEATGRFWEGIAKHVKDAQSAEMVRLRAENARLRNE